MSFVYWVRLETHTNILEEGYVGITTKTVEDRFTKHKKDSKNGRLVIHKALRKYGGSVVVETICECSTEYALILEFKLRPRPKIGWNITIGGGHPPSAKGIKRSPEFIQKSRDRMKGNRSLVEYTKTHHITVSEDTRLKISSSLEGRSLSEATKQSMVNARNTLSYKLKVCNKKLLAESQFFYNMFLNGEKVSRKLEKYGFTRQSLKTLWIIFEMGYTPENREYTLTGF